MKLIYQNKGLLIYLSNTAAVKAAKKRGEVVEPLYSLYVKSAATGYVRCLASVLGAGDIKQMFNQFIDLSNPPIDVSKLMNLDV